MNDLIRAKLKEIVKLQVIIKKDDLNYKRAKTYIFGKYSPPLVFLRDKYEGHLVIEKADNNQSNFAKNFEKDTKTFEKKVFFIIT